MGTTGLRLGRTAPHAARAPLVYRPAVVDSGARARRSSVHLIGEGVFVPSARGSCCRACLSRTSPGYSLCTSCRDVAVALGRPPVRVTPIFFVTPSSALYRTLRQYKSGEVSVARRQAARLGRVLGSYVRHHLRCLAPDGADMTAVVPSGRGGRPAPHPLAGVAARAGPGLPPVSDALAAGAGVVAHRRATRHAYRAAPAVHGRRILLLDDVYTSGAHLQSAAAALLDRGAAAVYPLVIGRYLGEGSDAAAYEASLPCLRCELHCGGAALAPPDAAWATAG